MNMEIPTNEDFDSKIMNQIIAIKDKIQRSGAVGSEVNDIDILIQDANLGKITKSEALEQAVGIESRRNDYH